MLDSLMTSNPQSLLSSGQLAQIAKSIANGLAPAPQIPQAPSNYTVSPNMQLYLNNLAQPSVYTQGLPDIPEPPPPPPEFDSLTPLNDLWRQWAQLEESWTDYGAGTVSAVENAIQNKMRPADDLRNWLTTLMNHAGQYPNITARNKQYSALSSGLGSIDAQEAQWKKDHPRTPTPLPSFYPNKLW